MTEKTQTAESSLDALVRARPPIALAAAIGLVAAYLYAASASTGAAMFFHIAGAGTVIAGAALLCGAVLGFLFGIPRTLQGTPSAVATQPIYQGNTNLEQISDWLTKIIIGVGLVQLKELPKYLHRLNTYLATALGSALGSDAFAGALVVYFALFGFFLGYLWTRLVLPDALRRAERETIQEVAREAAREANSESQMYMQLYQPGGYDDVIRIADEYRKQHGDPKTDRFWLYLACAWGQKLRDLEASGSSDAAAARANAIAAVRNAIAINPAQRSFLRALADPVANQLPPNENDLASLKDDVEFRRLVAE